MSDRSGVVALHPEAVVADPASVRWVVAELALPFTGSVAGAPGALGGLLAEGTLTAVLLEPGAVVTTLRDAPGWRSAGPAVRTALHAALLDLAAWVPVDEPVDQRLDEPVARSVRAALAGEAGAFVRSHGGSVELVEVDNGVVTLRLAGTCRGCSALGATVGRRLEGQLRRACPQVREVRAVT